MRRRLNPIIIITLFLSLFAMMLVARVNVNKTSKQESTVKLVNKEKKVSDELTAYLSQLSLEEKIGQLFFSRVPMYNQIEDLQTYHLGGYILFSRDIEGQSLDSLTATLTSYQSASKIPLLIGSDEEGGTVTRVSKLLDAPFQSPRNLYLSGGMAAVLNDAHQKADLLNQLGIKVGLFPVADIAQDSTSFIYPRTLGEDLETTKIYISQVVKVLEEEQSGSTLKHFPGYGDNEDSHTAIVYDNRSRDQLESYDFQVFKAGIDAGADSILVAHNIVPAIDNVPASISAEMTKILREELGFEGVIMTDDMDMQGLADFISQEEAAFRVLQAGNDMILSSQYAVQIPYLLEKVASGELTEERIDQSLRRILQWKMDLGLLELN